MLKGTGISVTGSARGGRWVRTGCRRLALACAVWWAAASPSAAADYAQREDVRQFAEELAQRHGWSSQATLNTLAQARYLYLVSKVRLSALAGQGADEVIAEVNGALGNP